MVAMASPAPFTQHPHVSVQLHEGEPRPPGPGLGPWLRRKVAIRASISGVPETARYRPGGDLGVDGLHLTLRSDDERVDLCHGGPGGPERVVELTHDPGGLLDLPRVGVELARQPVGLVGKEP